MVLGKVNYDGMVWNYLWIKPCLEEKDREHLIWNALDMERKEENKRNVQGEGYEGRILRKGRELFVNYFGIRFDCSIDVENIGRKDLAFLMIEPVNYKDN